MPAGPRAAPSYWQVPVAEGDSTAETAEAAVALRVATAAVRAVRAATEGMEDRKAEMAVQEGEAAAAMLAERVAPVAK